MAGAGVRSILIDGPWRHRDVAANGVRFHVATGVSFNPQRRLVLLLHGFAEFWWAWRQQIPALDAAGLSVAAMDLRGYGASDKTPAGYDPVTTAGDIAGVIRGLGYRRATVVGHDWGGMAAWSTAAFAPMQVEALVSVAAPHPLAFPWGRQLGRLAFFSTPLLPERRFMAENGAYVAGLLRSWAAPGSDFLSAADARRYRDALLRWPSPQCALKYQRVFVSNQFTSAGRRYRRALRTPLRAPLLSIAGQLDRLVPPGAMVRAENYVHARHERVIMAGVGHLPHEEAPEEFNQVLLRWLGVGG